MQYPIKLLIARRGDITFADLMYKLRCKGCHGQPTSIFLCASTARQSGFGLSPGWSLELKPHLAHTAAPERQAKKPSGEESRNEAHRVMKLVKS